MHRLFDEIINNIHLIGFMHHCDRDGKERQSSWKYELAQSNTMVVLQWLYTNQQNGNINGIQFIDLAHNGQI